MSQFLNFAGNQGTTFKNHGTGGGTSFTLDLQATTNSVLLAVGGVLQEPGVDYTVSGTTITTTTSVTAGIEVGLGVIVTHAAVDALQFLGMWQIVRINIHVAVGTFERSMYRSGECSTVDVE